MARTRTSLETGACTSPATGAVRRGCRRYLQLPPGRPRSLRKPILCSDASLPQDVEEARRQHRAESTPATASRRSALLSRSPTVLRNTPNAPPAPPLAAPSHRRVSPSPPCGIPKGASHPIVQDSARTDHRTTKRTAPSPCATRVPASSNSWSPRATVARSASSLGKCPRVRTERRSVLLGLSMALVV
jgi:hypothetical protein